ncbi:MAG: hypothetical protein K9K66_04455 [Desulfarculaceae bacterium]|nr:hypothetical protein [Desulfarculaceae bacterium]MCF8073295.1 hypothetical protein [Desulfarculaceae bacterium]MCF8100891.1 hypothetical protein [Desulfarculaceae bacterium]
MQNFIVLPQGGVTRRPGWEFIAEAKHHDKKARLIPFVFSEDQAYILEVGDGYVRFFYEDGQIEDPGSPGNPYEITGAHSEAQLAALKHFQHMDVAYLAHNDVAPAQLARSGHTNWAVASVSFTATPGDWGAGNYPGAVAIYEDRSFWAGCPDQPLRLYISKTYAYTDMTTGTGDSDAFIRTISARRANKVLWLEPDDRLIFGCVGGEIAGGVASSLNPITPTNFRVDPQGSRGSKSAQGRKAGDNVLFASPTGRRLYELVYDSAYEKLVGTNLSLRADHITASGIVDFDYAEEPYSVVWSHLVNGGAVGMTYYRPEGVVSWHQHPTQGEVESIAVKPGPDRDEVWALVKREINGQTKRYIERLASYEFDDVRDCFYVDSGITHDGAETDTITGLEHLEGMTVAILADGSVQPSQVVSSGQISLATPASKVHVGLPYTSRLQTLPIEAGAADGTAQGGKKRLHSVILGLEKSVGGYVGQVGQDMQPILPDVMDQQEDQPAALFTGKTKPCVLAGNYVRDGQVEVGQEEPLPLNITSIIPQMNTNDM